MYIIVTANVLQCANDEQMCLKTKIVWVYKLHFLLFQYHIIDCCIREVPYFTYTILGTPEIS